jgi:hypothetical protein
MYHLENEARSALEDKPKNVDDLHKNHNGREEDEQEANPYINVGYDFNQTWTLECIECGPSLLKDDK